MWPQRVDPSEPDPPARHSFVERACVAIRQGPMQHSWNSIWDPNERHKDQLLAPVPSPASSRAALAAGVVGSLALLPLVWAQAAVTRRRVPRLPPAKPPHRGRFSGVGDPIRVLAIGESTVSGIGLSRGD